MSVVFIYFWFDPFDLALSVLVICVGFVSANCPSHDQAQEHPQSGHPRHLRQGVPVLVMRQVCEAGKTVLLLHTMQHTHHKHKTVE